MHDDLSGLNIDLERADLEQLKEIIRQAEKFLDAQLQAGIAADQRAVTFSSVTAAVVAVLIGGFVFQSGEMTPATGLVILSVTFGLVGSLALSFFACRPTDWRYAGSNPRHWRDELAGGDSLKHSLAGQAHLYARGIIHNRDALEISSRVMNAALLVAGLTLVIGVALLAYAIICAPSA